MTDITTIWDAARAQGDWSLNGAQLQAGNDLTTAILISLFTDRQADASDVIPDGSADPRGWWADVTVPIGSRLWLLDRAKRTVGTLSRARDYIAEALQWLIDDGVVAKFDIATEWTRATLLGARIVAYKQDGTAVAVNFNWAWQGTN